MPQVPWLGAVVDESDRRAFLLRFIGGGVLVAVGIIGVVAVYAPGGDFGAVLNGVIFALVGLAGVAVVAAPAAVAHLQPAPRRARGAHPRAGARRGRRDGARPGAAHARADPAQRRRPQSRAAAGPRPGALAAQLALQADRRRRPSGSPPRWSRRRPRSRTRTRSRWRRWSSATATTTSGSTRSCRRARGAGERGPAREGADGLAVRRGRAGAAQRLRPRPRRRASTPLQWRTIGTACEARSSAAWSATAGMRRSAASPATAPRCD